MNLLLRGLPAVALLSCALWSPPARADLDVVFLLDTTGSMSTEIQEAKERVKQIASALQAARPDETVRLGVVAYRDRGDEYLTSVQPLSSNVDEVFGFLVGLRAGGGGDAPEDVLAGMQAVLGLDWSQSADKQVFLIGDAPPQHYADGPDMDALLDQARSQEVVFNAIGCRSLSGYGIADFQKIAWSTEGNYQHIGRVDTDQVGLAEAMLETLTGDGSETLSPLNLWPSSETPPSGGREIRDLGVLVRLGTWWSPLERGPEGPRSCTVTAMVPDGFALASTPKAALGDSGLHLTVPLTSGDGGVALYELERCLPSSTPLLVHLEVPR